MAYYLSPVGNNQQTNANGNPLVGGKIYTYIAGTSTPAATYTDSTSGTSQANPIILNSLGLPASPIWMLGGQSLKFIFKDSADVLIRTVDNVTGINDSTLLITSSEWVLSGPIPTYISGTSFSLVGDQTNLFQVARRVKSTNSGGTIYSTITASVYAANTTTVTVVNDSGVLDAGLSTVSYGLLAAINPSVATAITQATSDNSTKVATTAYVKAQTVTQIQTVSASVASNALTCSLNPTYLDFRSATLGAGTVNTRSVGTAISVVVPSTATLGTVSATQSRLMLLAIDNAGTVELAIVNLAGGNDLSETGLISTTAISAAATAANVIYSTTARTNVPYRVVGYVESTQATAGTWATAPSTIQGYGGQAMAAMSTFGYGQTQQNVVGSRVLSTTYYNTSGKPFLLEVVGAAGGTQLTLTVNGAATLVSGSIGNAAGIPSIARPIFPGQSYSVASGSAATTWYETK